MGLTPWASPVHPHARGERVLPVAELDQAVGSSPRPWGTRPRRSGRRDHHRFIPTPVGNAAWRCSAPRRWPVHPHARGERADYASQAVQSSGSSPRPWGTPADQRWRSVAARFIPTPVGNARGADAQKRSAPVHPHARGERHVVVSATAATSGSSPRPWGTHAVAQELLDVLRFIPTPVGNAFFAPVRADRLTVHPHARGEREGAPETPLDWRGSSPRPWGTQLLGVRAEPLGRFIPTPVGNAGRCAAASRPSSVHPHARGERVTKPAPSRPSVGSSPRPWGTPEQHEFSRDQLRFIPTPVGNAPSAPRKSCPVPVHPHARGERRNLVLKARQNGGSSPRPWGTPGAGCRDCVRRRFIPTPVGNAPSPTTPPRRNTVHPHARGERPCRSVISRS